MKPLIGVPGQREDGAPAGSPPRYVLNRSYVEAVCRAGGAVVVIPPSAEVEALRSVYGVLAGLLLAGGGDVEPALYRRPPTAELVAVDPERDRAELLLTRWAVEDDLPLLAICRGVQVLNVALGGTLIQDIPAEIPGALVHSPQTKPPRDRPQHVVTLAAGSRLAAILGQGRPLARLEVNSFHHQAAGEVAPALRAVAWAPDSVVEGLEHPDRSFVLGVQWHPEEMVASEAAQQALFRAYVEACKGRRSHQ